MKYDMFATHFPLVFMIISECNWIFNEEKKKNVGQYLVKSVH